ncbi:MAG: hypothetical protein AMXMBFR33_06690 [Candidatus Xenobia bacterium]
MDNLSPFRQEAARGHRESQACRLKFWKRDQINLAEAERSLDTLDTLGPDEGERRVLGMARAAAQPPTTRLKVLQHSLGVLAHGVSADLVGLAGVGLALRDLAGPTTAAPLAAQLPDSGLLGRVAPGPDWLLAKAARPMPTTASEWAATLADAPARSVRIALEELGDPAFSQALDQLKLSPQVREQLDRQTLKSLDLPLTPPQRVARFLDINELPPSQACQLGDFMLAGSEDQPVKRLALGFQEAPDEQRAIALRAAARQLDQPFEVKKAVQDLQGAPPREVARVLATIEPSPQLSLLTRVSDEKAVAEGLGALDLRPSALLEKLRPLLAPSETMALVDRSHDFLAAVLATPWSQAEDQARVAVAGWQAFDRSPSLAGAALSMARATPDLNQRRYLCRGALKAMQHPVADKLEAMTRLSGPNADWSQTALAMAALAEIDRRGGEPRPGALLAVVSQAAASWAGPAWRGQLEQFLQQDPDLGPVARSVGSLESLHLVLEDRLLGSAVSAPAPAAVRDTGQAVLVGGVRLEKKSPTEGIELDLTPSARALPQVQALDLGPPPTPGTKIEARWKEGYKSGVVVIYNPTSGVFEEHESYKSGVAGVYNPKSGQVEFRESYKSGVAGVYNVQSGQTEWHEAYKSGVAGVYVDDKVVFRESYKGCVAGILEPGASQPEFREAYKSGIAAVLNPATGKAEWSESYKSGVAGLYDPARGAVDFRESYKSGLAVASSDPERPTLVSHSFPYWEDEDPYD